MSTPIYLSNDDSEVSGYKVAYIGCRGPNASTSATAAFTTSAIVTTTVIDMTLTNGGTTAKWITAPLKSAVTISTPFFNNAWGYESAAGANMKIVYRLNQYTTTEQAAFATTSTGAELTTSSARVAWSANYPTTSESITSTAFSAGNRIAITPGLGAVGTGGASESVAFYYNQLTPASQGDSYIVLNETVEAGDSQFGDGQTNAIVGGPTVVQLQTLIDAVTPMVKVYTGSSEDITWQALKNEMTYQQDDQTA